MRTRSRRRRPLGWVVAGIVVAVAVIAIVAALTLRRAPTPPRTKTARPQTRPARVPSPLDGLLLPRRIAQRRPIAVMVENYAPYARPQSGLGAASIVYETLAEGGITRFMAVYLDRNAAVVGPVRSARPYFVRWAAGYKAIFAHAGGSPDAEALLFHFSLEGGLIADVNGLLNYSEFYRTTDRFAPHNLYTSTRGVRGIATRHGWNHPVPYAGFRFGRPAAPTRRPPQHIFISFSSPGIGSSADYNVFYRYDRARNVYWRRLGGAAAIDRDTGRQLAPTNVVVLFLHIAPMPGDPEMRVSVANVGRGKALFFHDGRATPGTWNKPSDSASLRLLTASGRVEYLDPGQTWVECVPVGSVVRYAP